MVACTPADSATPAAALEPVRAVDIAEGQQDGPVDVEVDGGAKGVEVTFREITIEPGSGSGEHCHYGQLIAVIEKGVLTERRFLSGCRPRLPRRRVDHRGREIPHEGRNEGLQNAVLNVKYVTPT